MATTYKILGQASPANTNNADVYTVGSGKQAVVSTIVITNVNTAAASATIYIRKAGAAAGNVNCLLNAGSVAVNDLKGLTIGITLEATDVITVKSSVANALTFQVFGSEVA